MIDLAYYHWEPLDVELHDTKGFSSEDKVFSRYLSDQANGNAQTHVLLDGNQIIAYYT